MFIENLENRQFLSADVQPLPPSNVTANIVKSNIQMSWHDNSINEDYFIVRFAKGNNPIGNVWSIKTTTQGLNTKSTTGTVTIRFPVIYGYSFAVQSYRNTPVTDINRWSNLTPITGIFINKPVVNLPPTYTSPPERWIPILNDIISKNPVVFPSKTLSMLFNH